ncbi:hypothetical protein BDQ94DRAFT_143636 [Aspergillus welwitschiae]|uniref:Uncharacterized protein n=1 Tax=Aspergillus welwitschiae TaxID=1341132 RepID=A0A3F3Q3G3_9EURO|nr:hypothetical protein BDQ94DRAFT_143636 [Aspergillus welwitschiae]RDH33718.1 hypothetical protein BDQ94DRAFT_143636 [Aspergillus welwitschiae]
MLPSLTTWLCFGQDFPRSACILPLSIPSLGKILSGLLRLWRSKHLHMWMPA